MLTYSKHSNVDVQLCNFLAKGKSNQFFFKIQHYIKQFNTDTK